MGTLTNALRRHGRVGLDPSIFIYQFEDSPRYATVAEEALELVASGEIVGATSVLMIMEVTMQPLRLGRVDAAHTYEALIAA